MVVANSICEYKDALSPGCASNTTQMVANATVSRVVDRCITVRAAGNAEPAEMMKGVKKEAQSAIANACDPVYLASRRGITFGCFVKEARGRALQDVLRFIWFKHNHIALF